MVEMVTLIFIKVQCYAHEIAAIVKGGNYGKQIVPNYDGGCWKYGTMDKAGQR